jgi:hypothetical protein
MSNPDRPRSPLDQQLLDLVTEACRHPPGSPPRQYRLTKVIRLVQPRLWRESHDYYADALQQTWVYFCKSICDKYDATKGSVPTWLNTYLRFRLQDARNIQQRRQQMEISALHDRDGEAVDLIEAVPDRDRSLTDVDVPLWERVRQWAETNPELAQVHIKDHPAVTAQVLILRRLLAETSWQDLSKEFGIPVPTLSSFYRRQCMTRLHNFGQAEGYIDSD